VPAFKSPTDALSRSIPAAQFTQNRPPLHYQSLKKNM